MMKTLWVLIRSFKQAMVSRSRVMMETADDSRLLISLYKRIVISHSFEPQQSCAYVSKDLNSETPG
jgi:hypothetical protein